MTEIIKKISVMLEMIKFRLTVLAMPFAFTGALLAAEGIPGLPTVLLVILAMVGARTAAMGFNRIVDRRFDAANPRTANRALAVGEIKIGEAWAMVVLASLLFFAASAGLNPLTLYLSPLALGLAFFYSLTKRFTSMCHLVLGLALGFAPLGGWVAVSGSLAGYPWALSGGVLFWVAGFDTIYGCLDADFDRGAGLRSLPARLGRRVAFRVAMVFHLLAFGLFLLTGIQAGLNHFYYLGLAVTAGALFYQHLIVSLRDLSRIKASFFSMNGTISVVIFVATWLSLSTA